MDVELREVRDFLATHEPWSDLPSDALGAMVAALQLRYHRRGTRLLVSGQANHSLHVLRSGALDLLDHAGDLVERLEPGASFGAISLLEQAPSRHTVVAIEDSLVLSLPGEHFLTLHREHACVQTFHDAVQARRVRRAIDQLHSPTDGLPTWLGVPLGHVIDGRPPVTITTSATVQQAAQHMTAHRVSSLLVTEGEQLTGIVTDRDLRSKVVAEGLPATTAVTAVMTPNPVTVPSTATAFDALLQMTTRSIHHLPVVDDGHLMGLVSQGDLVRLEQANPVFLVRDIARSPDAAGVAAVVATVPRLAQRLITQGASADHVTRLLTAVADATHRRLIALAEAELGPAPAPWCWLALGSQARGELGLSSDQDHALVHADGLSPDQTAWYAAVAERVTAGLASCGYPLCDGDAMATNPRWRASVSTWREHFTGWVRTPEPQAVLEAQIFFDARVVHGDASLWEALHRQVLAATPQASRFLAHLAAQAVLREPPLGFFRGFVLEKQGRHRDRLDLKAGGIHAVIELARVHALAHGIGAVGTVERLRALGRQGHLSLASADDLVDAFSFCSHVRLRHQSRQHARGEQPDNHIAPADLTSFERRHLRDAFEVIRKAQEGLTVLHNTHVLT